MSQELVYRMRTCAAALMARDSHNFADRLYTDIAELLIEASNLLNEPEPAEPLGDPMPAIEVAKTQQAARSQAVWTGAGELPTAKAQPCPSCGSIDARTVHRVGRRLMLTCPTCMHQWEYGHGTPG